jgi:hypothetical protein
MPLDPRRIQASTTPAVRNGDGSFAFKLNILLLPLVIGGEVQTIGTLDVWVASDQVCDAAAAALKYVASQLPPDIARGN